MKEKEINYFIEEMEAIGDEWTEEQVQDVYGQVSLEEALEDRKSSVDMHLNNLIKVFSYLNDEE